MRLRWLLILLLASVLSASSSPRVAGHEYMMTFHTSLEGVVTKVANLNNILVGSYGNGQSINLPGGLGNEVWLVAQPPLGWALQLWTFAGGVMLYGGGSLSSSSTVMVSILSDGSVTATWKQLSYSVTVRANVTTPVPILLDQTYTGYVTPHTFNLIGAHEISVPDTAYEVNAVNGWLFIHPPVKVQLYAPHADADMEMTFHYSSTPYVELRTDRDTYQPGETVTATIDALVAPTTSWSGVIKCDCNGNVSPVSFTTHGERATVQFAIPVDALFSNVNAYAYFVETDITIKGIAVENVAGFNVCAHQ